MDIFKSVTDGVVKAIDYVVEKNRKTALVNRVKLVIRNEEQNLDKAYIALGKYYFRNLRDPENKDTEHYCLAAENSAQRIDRAVTKLEELTAQDENESCDYDDTCEDCDSDCDECPYNEDFDSQATLQDLRTLDGIELSEEEETIGGTVMQPDLAWNEDEPDFGSVPFSVAEKDSTVEPANEEIADEHDSRMIPPDIE